MKDAKENERTPVEQFARLMLRAGLSLDEAGREIRKQLLAAALKENRGNICRAATQLRTHRNTVARLVGEFHLREVITACRDQARQASPAFGRRRKAIVVDPLRQYPGLQALRRQNQSEDGRPSKSQQVA